MMDVLRFWMERGIDGFRIDVLWQIVKSEGFEDNRSTRIGLSAGPSGIASSSFTRPTSRKRTTFLLRLANSSTATAILF